jgi:hypothetical protein
MPDEPNARTPILSDLYVTAALEPDSGLVWYTRSAVPYPSVDVLRAQHEKLSEAVTALAPERLALVIDVRDAPPRNDEAFEKEVTRAVTPLLMRFRAYAFLVKTAAGSLQVRRLSTSSGAPTNAIFTDERAARNFLSGK